MGDLVEQPIGDPSTNSILQDLTTKMTQVLSQNQTQIQTSSHDSSATQIGIRLDSNNYALWSQVVEMYISGKDKLGYINGDFPQPQSTDPNFRKWRTENAVVKGWLINSMDPSLIGNFIRFPTAKAVWDAIATTYFDGTDTSQVYALKRQVPKLKQGGGSIETYYNNLQGLWREIDFRRPNPMKCEDDIQKYNSIIQEDRVYTFLDGLDNRLDKIRGDVLQMKPFPTVEQAYAHVRREDLRQGVMLTKGDTTAGVAMLSRQKLQQPSSLQILPGGVSGDIVKGGPKNMTTKTKSPIEGGGCTHCGNIKHTRETCFKLHGYPEWWNELKAKKKRDVATANTVTSENLGRAALITTEPQLSLIPHGGALTYTDETTNLSDSGYSHQGDHWAWY